MWVSSKNVYLVVSQFNIKETLSRQKSDFRLTYFHVISPNTNKYTMKLDKRFYRTKQKQ